VILTIGSLAYVGLYGRRKTEDWIDLLFEVSRAMLLTSIVMMASTFLLYVKTYSRAAVLMFLPISILVLTGERFLFRLAQRKLALTKVNVRRILIVGSGTLARAARNAVLKSEQDGLELAGFLDTTGWTLGEAQATLDLAQRIQEAALSQRASEIVFADQPSRIEAVWPAFHRVRNQGISVAVATDLGMVLAEGDRIEEMGGFGFVTLKRRSAPGGVSKRLIELLLALAGIVLLAVPALVRAIQIALAGRRPIFVTQDIIGEHGDAVKILLFNCDAIAPSRGGIPSREGKKSGGPGGLCAAPLLLSVMAGRLALVGVRPRRAETSEADSVPAGKPGLFGTWKLARNEEEENIKDNEYLANWSSSLDLKTLARCLLKRRSG